ncbi:tumor necrosis factor ligand superfamily member 15-like isoform X2 [Haliotis rubra]|nr:tumor necrosis factor ligand superfamily member 15-like isoform X2 [Haliotis rubra]XP_046543582.1 tumor necrosis factor ligand superfamily member 15-like isoform X2 [Haliotis rubra]
MCASPVSAGPQRGAGVTTSWTANTAQDRCVLPFTMFNHSTQDHNMNKLSILGVALAVFNVVLLAALVGVVVRLQTHSRLSSDHLYSLNASQVITTTVGKLKEETNRVEHHCRSVASTYQTSGNSGKASAHVTLNSTVPRPHDGDVQILSWRHDIDAAFLNEGITCQDGGLTVWKGGYYYVYSQIVYSGNGTQELDYGRILHTVVKQKTSELAEAPTPLMRNLQSTPSIRRGRTAYTTSSLGATFYLEPNTRVMVKSSVPGNIDVSTPHSTYFGMFLI